MGDYIDCIQPNDPRFDSYSIDETYNVRDLSRLISKQIDDIKNYFLPIKDKIICLLTGNHEETIRTKFYRNVTLELCNTLGVKYGGYDCFVRLACEREVKNTVGDTTVYTIYATHGFGGARKSGAKINRLDDFANAFDVDIIMVGHEHKKIVSDSLKLRLNHTDKLRVDARKQVSVMTGSFLKGYIEGAHTYVESKGYAPNDLGVVKITIEPYHHNIHASM